MSAILYQLSRRSARAYPGHEVDQRILAADGNAMKGEGVIIRAGEPNPHGAGRSIASVRSQAANRLVVSPERVGQVFDWLAEMQLHSEPGGQQLDSAVINR